MFTVSQDPNAHVFYEVDWSEWLASRNYTASDIVDIEWLIDSGSAEITHTRNEDARSRCWVKGVPVSKKVKITSRISMPGPAPSKPFVTDDYSFYLFGAHR